MRPAEIIRSSGARTAALFLGIVGLAILVGGGAAYFIVHDELRQRHLSNLDAEIQFYENIFQTRGKKGVLESLKAHIETTRDHETVFHVAGADGTTILSNVQPTRALPQRGEVPSKALGLNEDYGYFVRSVMLGDVRLTLGLSAEDISEIQEIFLQAGLWALVLLVTLSVSGSFALASRSNQRIAALGETLDYVNAGRLDVRLPVSGRNDDIDQIAKLVNQSIDALKTVVETNRQISSDIAHDLKTPLNRLRIDVERAIEHQEKGQPVIAELESIEAESNRILATFDALLRISQIEIGARKERFVETDLACIVSTVTDFYRSYAEDMDAALHVKIEPNIPGVLGDRELLSQLLSNLIENAFKHAGRSPEIHCALTARNKEVCLEVSDNGPGIPASEREKALRRLYRLEKSRSTPGSGLGLSMVKAIAELHGASIELGDNDPGLVVTVMFPAFGNRG